MIRHEYKRKTAKKRSLKSLKSYDVYLADPNEKDHAPKGMVLLPGRNHLCDDDSPESFERAVRECQKNYLKVRDGLPGKRSAILWEEIIYGLGKGVYHTPEERDYIQNLIISRILPDSPSRPTWHINPKTGMDDLHIPFSAKTTHGKMTLARTEVPLAKRLKQLDEEIADYLNARPNPKRKHLIKSSRRVAVEKAEKRHRRRGVPMPCPLPEQIAKLVGDKEINLENIHHWLGQLSIAHEPTNNGKGLRLTYPKLRKAGNKFRHAKGRYPIRELVLLIKEARFDLDLVKYPEKYQDSTVGDPVAPTEPVTTEPVTTEPVTTEPVTTEPVTTEPVTTEPITTEPVSATIKEQKTEVRKRDTKSRDKNDEMQIN